MRTRSPRRQVGLHVVVTTASLSLVGVLIAHADTGAAAYDGTPPSAAEAWPGGSQVTTASVAGQFGTDLSGLVYEPAAAGRAATLWAVRNDPATLYRLERSGTDWVPATSDGWSAGKPLRNPGNSSSPDAEGVTITAAGSSGGVYVASERSNSNKNVSSLTVLRYDVGGSGQSLTPTRRWDLTGDLPAVDPNKGFESVAWVPDSVLTAAGLVDERAAGPYVPSAYPDHGDGLFFVGVEQTGIIYAYALDHSTEGHHRIATIRPTNAARTLGAAALMDLQWDGDHQRLWATCDNGCQGRSATYEIATSGDQRGAFALSHVYLRPGGLANANHEGFAFAPDAECTDDGTGGRKPAWWADDDESGGYSIREGTLSCVAPVEPTPDPTADPTPTESPSATPDETTSPTPSATPSSRPSITPTIAPTIRPTPSPTHTSASAAIRVKALSGRRIRVVVRVAGLAGSQLDLPVTLRVAGARRTYRPSLENGVGVVRLRKSPKVRTGARVRVTVTLRAFSRTVPHTTVDVRRSVARARVTVRP
ncbi:hypothetical protein [Nocardioides sp. W7]|uniref:hypothetical protein n=1 Tax=Nocardioides sp. W7 TaxID=2931390 RepID=UPI001FD5A74B|nr:hypothetical protein [Nocardioides sp. W7]